MIKFIKKLISTTKYHFAYLGVLNSPFKGLRLKWYFGEIEHGTPYFLPRKWVNLTYEDALDKLDDYIKKGGVMKGPWDLKIEEFMRMQKAVPIKYFGWDSCTLGWKTKWSNDDFRFEWAPCYSLVMFGKQLFVCVLPAMDKNADDHSVRQDCYWEAYLTYKNCTDKTKSKEDRLKETIKQYYCTWTSANIDTDYYQFILKKKYLKIWEILAKKNPTE